MIVIVFAINFNFELMDQLKEKEREIGKEFILQLQQQ